MQLLMTNTDNGTVVTSVVKIARKIKFKQQVDNWSNSITLPSLPWFDSGSQMINASIKAWKMTNGHIDPKNPMFEP